MYPVSCLLSPSRACLPSPVSCLSPACLLFLLLCPESCLLNPVFSLLSVYHLYPFSRLSLDCLRLLPVSWLSVSCLSLDCLRLPRVSHLRPVSCLLTLAWLPSPFFWILNPFFWILSPVSCQFPVSYQPPVSCQSPACLPESCLLNPVTWILLSEPCLLSVSHLLKVSHLLSVSRLMSVSRLLLVSRLLSCSLPPVYLLPSISCLSPTPASLLFVSHILSPACLSPASWLLSLVFCPV